MPRVIVLTNLEIEENFDFSMILVIFRISGQPDLRRPAGPPQGGSTVAERSWFFGPISELCRSWVDHGYQNKPP